MATFHDETDSLEQLIFDIEDSDNPQHGTPDSVQESARQELEQRGYSKEDIDSMRLGTYQLELEKEYL